MPSSLHILAAVAFVAIGSGLFPMAVAPAAAAQGKSKTYMYETDPPDQAVSCRQRVTVKASRHCGGKPATIIGGCASKGIQRRVICG
jgi:hypothetical protein